MSTTHEKLDQFTEASAELRDELAPSAKEAADWLVSYHRLQHPASVVLSDGEQMKPKDLDDEKAALNTALKRYIEANGPLTVEGTGTLILQPASTEKVDLISLYERSPETVMRLLKLGVLQVDMKLLDQQQKNGMIADHIPRMPIQQTPRLVWRDK